MVKYIEDDSPVVLPQIGVTVILYSVFVVSLLKYIPVVPLLQYFVCVLVVSACEVMVTL